MHFYVGKRKCVAVMDYTAPRDSGSGNPGYRVLPAAARFLGA